MRRIVYSIVRDVVRGSNCSYPAGRTILNREGTYTNPDEAKSRAELYNSKCLVPGVFYQSIGHDEMEVLEVDHWENGSPPEPELDFRGRALQ